MGHRLSDTQTGLRAIPRGLMERMLRVSASGYEFELEMLIAARHLDVEVIEEPIETFTGRGTGRRTSSLCAIRCGFTLCCCGSGLFRC